MTSDALAHLILAKALFLFIKSMRCFNFQGITEQQSKRAVQHSHVGVQNGKHIIQEFFDVSLMDDDCTDLLNDRDFWTYWLFHNL